MQSSGTDTSYLSAVTVVLTSLTSDFTLLTSACTLSTLPLTAVVIVSILPAHLSAVSSVYTYGLKQLCRACLPTGYRDDFCGRLIV
jgi:hypothetical protein